MTAHSTLTLSRLKSEMIHQAVTLDQQTLGGLWTVQGYQTEIDRDKSICLGIMTPSLQLIGMGVTWVVIDEAHITLIAVNPQWQTKGLGSIILNRMLNLAIIQQNCAHATLEVGSANQSALDLYLKFQFQALGKRPNYYGQGNDAIILWRNQLQSDDYQSFLQKSFRDNQLRLKQQGLQLNSQET